MPKKKRTLTEEQREALRQRLALARAKKQEKRALNDERSEPEAVTPVEPMVEPTPEPSVPIKEDSVDDLRRRVGEMQDLLIKLMSQGGAPGGAQVTPTGVVGTTTKYSVDPKAYQDPTGRIADEPKLQRFAFRHNYELTWEVTSWAYDTKDNLRYAEPKFDVELRRIMLNKDGEPTSKRFVIRRATFFWDPIAALAIAREQGYELPEQAEKPFLEEMMYLRVRDWVMEAFYPPQITETKRDKKEMVIDNRLVEVFEISSTDSQTIPFEQLEKKF